MDGPLIYLSGSIKKGARDGRDTEDFWTPENEATILNSIRPEPRLLNPARSRIRRSDYHANYGCDLAMVESSSFVLVDLRRERGIGVGAELMFAQIKAIPVVAWSPLDTQYRRTFVEDVYGEDLHNWIHPFAFGLCDFLEETLEAACDRINSMIRDGGRKTTPSLDSAVAYFKRLYPNDPF